MALIDRLSEILRGALAENAQAPAQAPLAAAALLALVARVDGRLLKIEEDGLTSFLQSRFALAPEQASRLLGAVEAIHAETDPAAAIATRIRHDIASEDRAELLTLAYRLAAVDGQIHEFEDDLIWRVGRLLGMPDHAIAATRTGAGEI